MTKTWDQMTADEKADELLRRIDNLVRQQNQINENTHARLKALEAANGASSPGRSDTPG